MALKEVKVRPLIEEEDYKFKLASIIRFLGKGDQVKLIVVFRGREMAHRELGENLLLRFTEDLEAHGKAKWPPVMDGRRMPLVFEAK